MTEARGAIGRLFRDLPGSRDGESWSQSLRQALLDPRLSTNDQHRDRVEYQADVPPPHWAMASARRESGASPPLEFRHNSSNPRASVQSGLLSSWEYDRQRAKGQGERAAAAAAASRRYHQFHVCFLALHTFCQEHGHLPVALDREQADEIVRVAEELVRTGKKVRVSRTRVPSGDAALGKKYHGAGVRFSARDFFRKVHASQK